MVDRNFSVVDSACVHLCVFDYVYYGRKISSNKEKGLMTKIEFGLKRFQWYFHLF